MQYKPEKDFKYAAEIKVVQNSWKAGAHNDLIISREELRVMSPIAAR